MKGESGGDLSDLLRVKCQRQEEVGVAFSSTAEVWNGG